MLVTPVPNVVGEDIGAQSQTSHPPILSSGSGLRMLHHVAMVEPGIGAKNFFDCIEKHLDRSIAIAVHMHVEFLGMESAECVDEILGSVEQQPMVIARVIPRGQHDCGPTLDRPIKDQLDPLITQLERTVVVAQVYGHLRYRRIVTS